MASRVLAETKGEAWLKLLSSRYSPQGWSWRYPNPSWKESDDTDMRERPQRHTIQILHHSLVYALPPSRLLWRTTDYQRDYGSPRRRHAQQGVWDQLYLHPPSGGLRGLFQRLLIAVQTDRGFGKSFEAACRGGKRTADWLDACNVPEGLKLTPPSGASSPFSSR